MGGFVYFDLFALLAVAVMAWFTPASSHYRAINLVLLGEFTFSIGLAALIDLFVYEGTLPYIIQLAKDLVFCYIFFKVGGLMLGRVQRIIALFHASMIFAVIIPITLLDSMYQWIMAALCVTQLLCCLRGALHGCVCSHYVIDSGGEIHRRRPS